jgi:DNA adenine methylase
MSRFHTPLRYPGGKARLSAFVQLVLAHNNLGDIHYVEPYCGGAGIAFPLLFLEHAAHVHLNDFNRSVYLFWKAVLDRTDDFCDMISAVKVTASEWRKQKKIQSDPKSYSEMEVAFSTFFMNRCNRSGIINGGMIGGQKQRGAWKIDARFNKDELISRIKKIGRYRNRISLYNLDAEQLLVRIDNKLPAKTLIYLDPPYYVKGAGLYEDHYQHHDHKRLAKFVQRRLLHPWIVSYDNHPDICAMYKDRRRIQYSLSYTAGERYFGTEVIFFSDSLSIPKVLNPCRLAEHPKTPIIPARYIRANRHRDSVRTV